MKIFFTRQSDRQLEKIYQFYLSKNEQRASGYLQSNSQRD